MALSCVTCKLANSLSLLVVLTLLTSTGAQTCQNNDRIHVAVGAIEGECICFNDNGLGAWVPRDRSQSFCECGTGGRVFCPQSPPSSVSQLTCTTINFGSFKAYQKYGNCACLPSADRSSASWQAQFMEQESCSCEMDGADPTGRVTCPTNTKICRTSNGTPNSVANAFSDNGNCQCSESAAAWEVTPGAGDHPLCSCSSGGWMYCPVACKVSDNDWVDGGFVSEDICKCSFDWETRSNTMGVWSSTDKRCSCSSNGNALCPASKGSERQMAKQAVAQQEATNNGGSWSPSLVQGALIFVAGACCAVVGLIVLLVVVHKNPIQNMEYQVQVEQC